MPSYALNPDGRTVFDTITGLTWMRSPNMTNTPPVKGDRMSYAAAQLWVNTVNAANYGGFNDWRIPTIKELYSLYMGIGTDPGGSNSSAGLTPFIDTNYFKFAYGNTAIGERVIDQQYMSSNLFIFNPSESGWAKDFGVNFSDGRIKGYDTVDVLSGQVKTFYVQLVRGPLNYGKNHFIYNGDQTISDTSTNLMWTKNDNGSGLHWTDALAWVQTKNSANYLGHNDWRLPNIKELQSIVDYSHASDYDNLPAIDTAFFNCTPIINEQGQTDFPYYWSGTTHEGYSITNQGGGEADYVPFGRALGWPSTQNHWVDVHGAGCQRSDPKVGPPYPYAIVHTVIVNGITYIGYSHGPQGDAIRGTNYVRMVRDIGNTTGINEELNDRIIIYPNPSNVQVEIKGVEYGTLEILNEQCQIINKVILKNSSTTIDISGLTEGFYFFRIYSGGGCVIKKFIKQ